MAGYDIATLSRRFDDIRKYLSPGLKVTQADRELIRLRFDEVSRFMSACQINHKEIEAILNFHRRAVK